MSKNTKINGPIEDTPYVEGEEWPLGYQIFDEPKKQGPRVRMEITLLPENKAKLTRLAKNSLSRSHYLEAFIEAQKENIDSPV